jgi:ribosomal protein L11 methyltransferase
MTESYLCIRCVISVEMEEDLPELLAPWPVLGSEIEQSIESAIRITIYLGGSDEAAAHDVGRVLARAGATQIETSVLEAADWLAAFRASLQPFEVGDRWWIDPRPDRPTAAPAGRQRLTIEPRTAFGAGTHESTQGVLKILENLEVAHLRVLDVGTGSGILALAAESLGAEWVVGFDVDPTAVWVATECAAQQEWETNVRFVAGTVDCFSRAEFDIVLCNMIASNVVPLAPALRGLLANAGIAVLAGLLASEVESVSLVLRDAGFAVTSRSIDGEWATVTAVAETGP